jgi:putative redox protein
VDNNHDYNQYSNHGGAMKKAIIKRVQGMTFTGKADSNHWVMMDGSLDEGGSAAATSPKELVLVGLGGCTGMDVASILKKKRAQLNGLELHITAEEADDFPRIFTKIHIEYVFLGKNIRPQDVERAIELSQTKYCSVTAMLRSSAAVSHSYRIENQ